MTDDHNKDSNPEFEDDTFDELEFDESYYDEESTYDEADLAGDEEFEDTDFDEADWNEEEAAPLAGKKDKSLYRSEKKSFLSFNTIVIIGAFIVGAGVLVFTVMNQSAQVASSLPEKFRSGLNIGEVMDGGIFGIGADDKAEPETATNATDDTVPATETGFLDNPENIELQANDLPPQPSPISPTEIAPDTLTPLPEVSAVEPIKETSPTPRGPDDVVAAVENDGEEEAVSATDRASEITPETPVEPEAPASAEDILKRALANREQKQAETAEAEPAKTDIAESKKTEEIPVVALEPVPEPAPAKKEEAPAPAVKALPAPVIAQAPSVSEEKVSALENKIDTLLKRMEEIESELDTVRDGREDKYETLAKTVSGLKGDIVALKNAPAPKPEPVKAEPERKPAPVKAEEKKVAKAEPKPVSRVEEAPYSPPKKPAPATVSDTSSETIWELRAAQPGKAWVSRKGQRDMQGVVVGESLPGIGRVTSINYEGGRWIVVGTQGQIRQ